MIIMTLEEILLNVIFFLVVFLLVFIIDFYFISTKKEKKKRVDKLTSEADFIIKLTTIDGVYTDDPKKNPNATKYDKITFKEVIDKELGIMDMEAMEICRDNDINIIVTDINNPNALLDIINNKSTGTIVTNQNIIKNQAYNN